MWWGQVIGLLLQEITHNILADVCRAAIHRSGGNVRERRKGDDKREEVVRKEDTIDRDKESPLIETI